jgi:branched-chain amino acid transport system ATP-binding protein
MTELLTLESVEAYYGMSHVLHSVSLSVGAGEVVLLLGRNGAGKSTIMRTIIGLVATRGSGRICYAGRDITGWLPHNIARLGIGLVPEDRRMFAKLTVRDNLELGRKSTPAAGQGKPWDLSRVFDLFPALADLQTRRAGTLSGGQQQMLAIARALMGNPQLLMLDEPAEGLAPIVVETLAQQLALLRAQGLSMLVSEQNLSFSRTIADRAYVIETGSVCYQGTLAELDANPQAWTRYISF